MKEGLASTGKERKTRSANTLWRLVQTFLPHFPLFLATLASTGLYAGAMTLRVAAVYPVLRVVTEEVPEDERGEIGEVSRTLVKNDGEFSPTLKRVNEILDRVDAKMVSALSFMLPQEVLDSPKKRAQVGTLATTIVLFIGIIAISAISNFLKYILRALLVVRVLIVLRVRLLQNLLRQPLAFYNDQKRGELITRMSADVAASTTCLNTLTGPLILQPFMILMPVIVLVASKWWLVFPVLIFLAVITFQLRKRTRKVHRRARVRQRTVARVTEAMVQMFSGIRVVKAFGLEDEKVDQYTRRNEEFARDAMATERAKGLTRTWMELITHVTLLIVFVGAAIMVGAGGQMPAGAMLFFIVFMSQIYRPTKQLTNAFTDLQDSLAGADRTFEFIDLEPGLQDKRDAIALRDAVGTVRFEDVSFSYNGNGKVLEHINLEVPAGQVVALVGHSGAGKSTMVNLVPRFYDPNDGRITIDGTDIREFTRESLLENIAIVTQEPFLFNSTVRENIAYGLPGATDAQIKAAAEAANIHEFIEGLPRGYETIVGERGANLSGGQCQRLTIARALIRDARILILDEATSSLDSESEHAVQQALQNLMKGRTTLVIAHRLSTVQHADKICVMQDGRICEVGTHTQLMASDSLYRRLYQLQFAK